MHVCVYMYCTHIYELRQTSRYFKNDMNELLIHFLLFIFKFVLFIIYSIPSLNYYFSY